jgi:hypothetical protein
MASEFPNSYKDQLYASLDAGTEKKLGLPTGLLSAIRTRGERSNHDQTNSEKTATVYQFIPSTAKAIEKKYGIDPLLSPENASEAAGLLLKESLARNQNDPKLAVAEYIGGVDRKNWGPTTKAYIQRVTGGLPTFADLPASAPSLPNTPQQSTYDRLQAQQQVQQAPASIANIYAAYRDGKMDPEAAKEFEEDVAAGKMMLPRGATMAKQPERKNGGPVVLDRGIADAYNSGKMDPEARAELDQDLKSGMVAFPAPRSDQIPTGGDVAPASDGNSTPTPPTSIGDKIIGAGEAALSTATGMTGGAIGMAAGTASGMADAILSGQFGTQQAANMVEQAASRGAEALTYAPRTPSGQAQTAAIGSAMQAAVPMMPLTAELGAVGRTAPALKMSVGDVAAAAPEALKTAGGAVRGAAQAVGERLNIGRSSGEPVPTAGTMASGGAAGTDMALQRQQLGENLLVPIRQTKGQITRDQQQLQFENETAKSADGKAFRDRYAEQNKGVAQNFEAMIDGTGAEKTSTIETGRAVNDSLTKAAAKAKTEYRAKYAEADKAGETAEPVSLQGVVDHLNDSAPEATTAPLLNTARAVAIKLGIAKEVDGVLVAPEAPVSLKTAEQFRKTINRSTDYEATNVRQSAILKGLVDEATEGAGGDVYKGARKARQRYAQLFEDNAVVSDLLKTRKGTADRQVALEDVFQRTMLNGSRDDLTALRRTLHVAGGEEGQQAWKELQGATIRHIADQATRGVGMDTHGNQIISASGFNRAVKAMDEGGKLDFILSKKGAQTIRDLNELSRYIYTAPPGTINTSNTAGVVLAALAEAGVTGSLIGLPVPVMSGIKALAAHAKNRKLQARIKDALEVPTNSVH